MNQAQDEVFSRLYYEPAKQAATDDGVSSALGILIYYDTKVQGGLKTVRKHTHQHFLQGIHTEQEWLSVFLNERKEFLRNTAASQRTEAATLRKDGNEGKARSLEKNAGMLEGASRYRIGALQGLVGAGNLDLTQSDVNEQIPIAGKKVFAIDSSYRQVVDLIAPDTASGAQTDFAHAFRILKISI